MHVHTTSTNRKPADDNGSSLKRPDRLSLKSIWESVKRLNKEVQDAKPKIAKGRDAPVLKVVMAIVAGCVTPALCLVPIRKRARSASKGFVSCCRSLACASGSWGDAGFSDKLLAMSTLAGTIAMHGGTDIRLFAVGPLVVLVTMLAVSTPHLAAAKQTMGWSSLQSWSFAIGLDAAIVVSELADVFAHDALAPIWYVPATVILGAVVYSASLNSYVNLMHIRWSKVIDPRDVR